MGNKYKILVTIPNFGNNNLIYLKQMLKSFDNFSNIFKINVIILSTEKNELGYYKNIKIEEHFYNERIEKYLPQECRQFFIINADKYDIFIHTDNDHLFEEKHLKYFIETSMHLNDNKIVPGFIQFELKNNEQYLIGLDHNHYYNKVPPFFPKFEKYNNEYFFKPYNLHQSLYMLTKENLKYLMSHDNFMLSFFNYKSLIAQYNTYMFRYCGLNRAIPIKNYDDCFIHHLPNKYCNLNPPLYINYTKKKLISDIKNSFKKQDSLNILKEKFDILRTEKSYLLELFIYGGRCNTIIELGTGDGSSTIALLLSDPQKLITIDIMKNIHIEKLLSFKNLKNLEFIQSNSLKYDINQQYDLLFINTVHTYNQLYLDLIKFSKFINKYIIIHGTFEKYIENFLLVDNKNGLTILRRK